MKKLLLAAAIAATVSTGAQAVGVTSNVTGSQLFLGFDDTLSSTLSDGSSAGGNFNIGGDTVTGLTFSGNATFASGPDVQITFALTDGARQGVNGAGGTVFSGGTITIATQTPGTVGFLPYAVVDASDADGQGIGTNINFLSGVDGHLGQGGQSTAGLVVDDAGNGTLGGLWDGQFFGAGFSNAASSVNLFSNSAGFFLEGTISAAPSAVPVPAAAWLFGSALVGLAGKIRQQKNHEKKK
jgi:hypothetical protein